MTILMIDNGHRCIPDVVEAWEQNGAKVIVYRLDDIQKNFRTVIDFTSPDIVFSMQYYDRISQDCFEYGLLYLAWVADFCMELYCRGVNRANNYIFAADYHWMEKLRKRGAEQSFYLPLAANIERLDKAETGNVNHEVTFAGNCEEVDYYGPFGDESILSPSFRGYLEGVAFSQRVVYGVDILSEGISDTMIEGLYQTYPAEIPERLEISKKEWYFHKYFYSFINYWERYLLLALCGDCVWYTKKIHNHPEKIEIRENFNYYKDFPGIVKASKINLNITDRRMSSGISQRIFDILGCKGFLLTNYQQELGYFFEPGKDFAVFENKSDFLYEVDKYRKEDSLRQEMAERAYEKVKNAHTYQMRIQMMLETLENTIK